MALLTAMQSVYGVCAQVACDAGGGYGPVNWL